MPLRQAQPHSVTARSCLALPLRSSANLTPVQAEGQAIESVIPPATRLGRSGCPVPTYQALGSDELVHTWAVPFTFTSYGTLGKLGTSFPCSHLQNGHNVVLHHRAVVKIT